MLCDENGIGGDGEYSGDNDAQLGLINVFYHWASGGMYVPRADLFNLKPGVITLCARRLSETSSVRKTSRTIRAGKLGQRLRTCLPKG